MEQKPFIRSAVFLGPEISTATSRNAKLRDASRMERRERERNKKRGGRGRRGAEKQIPDAHLYRCIKLLLHIAMCAAVSYPWYANCTTITRVPT